MWQTLAGQKIYLDSNILIFSIERGNPWSSSLRDLFTAIEDKTIRGCTSELTLAEVLAKPLRVGATSLVEKYEAVLAPDSPVETVPIDRSVLRRASRLQGELGLKLMDAIHAATAALSDCDQFLTHDSRMGRKVGSDVPWLSLPAAEEP
jgi:uncharacterized protein